MYCPLGIKTDYSLLKSLIKIKDLVLYAKNNGLKELGILDDNLNSSYTFYKECVKNDIKPIIGLDITIDNYRLFLYPTNMQGLINLFKLMAFKLTNVIGISDLEKYSHNVILVLPYESVSLYDTLKTIFTKVFLSFSNESEEVNAKIITDDIIYIRDIYALTINQCKYVNYLHMIDKGLKLGSMELVNYEANVLKVENYDTDKLTSLINIEFDTSKRYIPPFSEEIDDCDEYLRNLSIKGLTKRLNGKVSEEYQKRLNYELKIISDMGFGDYFLIVFDYVRFAIKNNIVVGSGRGSAVGSLVAYSLGITWIDPLKYDLVFERFLNPERITMPDIDIDFEAERREEVVEYVKNKYGEKKVAKIIAYGTMTAKDVLRSVAKINNVDDGALNSLLKYVNSKKSLKDNLTKEVNNILNRNSSLRKVYDESFYLEGIKKHITTHAAGIVICSKELTDLIPICISGNEILTGFDKDELEELGILKMDFLSIKNLTIMANIINDIEKYTGKKININRLPLDDKEVYELFSKADTIGVFQFEAMGMRNFLRRLKPTCFDDLIMAVAIYRPGPMEHLDSYVARKNKRERVKYLDDALVNILNSTYGILVYQEQILEILRTMGDFSYAEADIIRRAISKKKASDIEKSKAKFITNAVKKGYGEESALKVYEAIAKFAEFGFNKSHSVGYALFAYQMAYLKVHYKEYFYINVLNNNIGSESKTKEYIDEAKQMGINILKPDINLSSNVYSKESDGIRLPLRVIKGVGSLSSDAIISKRDKPFEDFFDFIGRCYGFNVNKKTIEALILAGVFDAYGYNRATLMKNINSAITYAELVKDLDSSLVSKPMMNEVVEYPEMELMEKELELFGYYVSTHPASKYPNMFKLIDTEKYFDKRIETVVLIENIKKIKTKTNKDMAFLTASDETRVGDFTCFDTVMPELNFIKKGDLVKINGKVEKRLDKYSIIVNKIEKV